jgi:predicted AAA+ superfamily ATPase
MVYKNRLIDEIIVRKLKSSGGVLLKGPRFVGKTTTAKHHSKSFVRLDESEQMRRQASLDPESILRGNTPRLIDEWQVVPSLWNAARTEIDKRQATGQFILTRSSAPSDDDTMHTGAGRFARISMRPMSLHESGNSTSQVDFASLFSRDTNVSGIDGLTVAGYAEQIVIGGWPSLVDLTPEDANSALTDYVQNIAYVDMRTLKSPPQPERVTALMQALSRNIATEVSYQRLAMESEIYDDNLATTTIRKYLDQLSQIFVVEELPSWKTHIRSSAKLRVKPKWHFIDPSLACAILGILPDKMLDDLNFMGFLFESLAIRDLRIYSEMINAKVYHYRDSSNLEIDAIVERLNGEWAAFEVKLGGENAIEAAVRNFKLLKQRLSERRLHDLKSLNIITAGKHSYTREDGINIISLGHLRAGSR